MAGSRRDAVRIWRVRPKGSGERWLVISPEGHVTEFVKGDLGIEFGRQMAQAAHEILEVWTSEGRISATEDFRLN